MHGVFVGRDTYFPWGRWGFAPAVSSDYNILVASEAETKEWGVNWVEVLVMETFVSATVTGPLHIQTVIVAGI